MDEGTCSIDLLEAASGFFAMTRKQARAVFEEVATATAARRHVATAVGVRAAAMNRMASAFEQDDLRRAQAL